MLSNANFELFFIMLIVITINKKKTNEINKIKILVIRVFNYEILPHLSEWHAFFQLKI